MFEFKTRPLKYSLRLKALLLPPLNCSQIFNYRTIKMLSDSYDQLTDSSNRICETNLWITEASKLRLDKEKNAFIGSKQLGSPHNHFNPNRCNQIKYKCHKTTDFEYNKIS